MDDRAWLELLDEFRALGGTAENVRMGMGALGRGLFPIDPAKPVALCVPAHLLVPTDDMVFENGVLKVGPEAKVGARERAWLERYQECLGWSAGGGDEIRRQFEEIARLPEGLRHDLATRYHCGHRFVESGEEAVQRAYLHSRTINRGDDSVLIPVIDLANHGETVSFDVDETIGLRGTFAGEVLVRYSDADPIDYFLTWGFPAARPLAFSLPLMGQLEGGVRLKVERAIDVDFSKAPKPWVPRLTREGDVVTLDFLMLANERYPRLAKGIFERVLGDAGFARLDEPFDVIQHINRMHYLDLMAAVEDCDLPVAHTLRAAARQQLRALSFHYGTRSI